MRNLICTLFGSKKIRTKLKEIQKIEESFLTSQNKVIELVDMMIEKENLIHAIFNAVPDWIWHKDLDGVYVKVNDKIREELFGGLEECEIIGFNDIEIANKLKCKYGEDNHTFGALCNGSDHPVLTMAKPMKFNEWGRVGRTDENGNNYGKELRVIVHKNVIRAVCGKVVGTVGMGFNITDDYNYLQEVALLSKDPKTADLINKHNNKDVFTLDQSCEVI